MNTTDEISLDGEVVTICGIKYAMDLFRQLGGLGGKTALPLGATFKLVSRADGVIEIFKLEL